MPSNGTPRDCAKRVATFLNLELPVESWAAEEGIAEDDIRERINEAADKAMAARAQRFGPQLMQYVGKSVMLQTLDHLWREHLVNLDHLRSVIGFRGYAQRDPLNEYKSESFELFQTMLGNLREAVTAQMSRVEIVQQQEPEPVAMQESHPAAPELAPPNGLPGGSLGPAPGGNGLLAASGTAKPQRDPKNPQSWGKVGRNEACPCGSGKKFKHCHGAFV